MCRCFLAVVPVLDWNINAIIINNVSQLLRPRLLRVMLLVAFIPAHMKWRLQNRLVTALFSVRLCWLVLGDDHNGKPAVSEY